MTLLIQNKLHDVIYSGLTMSFFQNHATMDFSGSTVDFVWIDHHFISRSTADFFLDGP